MYNIFVKSSSNCSNTFTSNGIPCFSSAMTRLRPLGLWTFLSQKCLLEGLDVWEMLSIAVLAEDSFLSESMRVLKSSCFVPCICSQLSHRRSFVRWTRRVSLETVLNMLCVRIRSLLLKMFYFCHEQRLASRFLNISVKGPALSGKKLRLALALLLSLLFFFFMHDTYWHELSTLY